MKGFLQRYIPASRFGRGLSFLFLALFLLFPFQHRQRGLGKAFFKKMYAAGISFPSAFSKTLTLEYSDFFLLGILFLLLFRFRVSLRLLFWEGSSKFLSLFLAVSAFSIVMSEWGGHLFQYVWLLKFSLSFLLFFALRISFSPQEGVSLICRIAWIFLGAACIVSLIGIGQYFLQTEVGLRGLGESTTRGFLFLNPSQKRWFFDGYFATAAQFPSLLRSCSTFYHPNAFGGFLFISLLFTFYLYLSETRRACALFLGAGIFLQCFTLVTTYSRSALLALIVATAVLSFLWVREAPKKIVQLFSILVCSAGVCFFLFSAQIFARGGIVNYTSHVQMADQERVTYQKAAIAMEKNIPGWEWALIIFNFTLRNTQDRPD